jgi:hypothetical protein
MAMDTHWISGHAVYGWRRRHSIHGTTPELRLRERELLTDPVVLQSLAKLCNELEIGHGQSTRNVALARHARLALNATVTVAEFVLDHGTLGWSLGVSNLWTERPLRGGPL